jgi:succinyl-diaminopimelate desuccinylase
MEVLPLAQALLRCRSVTPADDGAQGVLAQALGAAGFEVTRLKFGEIENLYAERPGVGGHLCFAGHTDVVPPGPGWRHDPFGGVVEAGVLYGRGAVDMKGGVAAFCAAAAAVPGHVSLLITGDEEGHAVDGTVKVLDWMAAIGKRPDFCVVGEPTSQVRLGDCIKVGRRGSLYATITLPGRQGHSAYPHRADNPIHRLVAALAEMIAQPLDAGTAVFEPSTLQVTQFDTGNAARNVIPGESRATINIRFNDLHSAASLTDRLTEILARLAPAALLDVECSGEAFTTAPGPHLEQLAGAITSVTGLVPARNTGGGTSDARFIHRICPVAEFGLVGSSMHQCDERVPVEELDALTGIYRRLVGSVCA